MEEEKKRSIADLIAEANKDGANKARARAFDRAHSTKLPPVEMWRHIPRQLSLARIRSMSDEALMKALAGDDGEERSLSGAAMAAITMELMRRQADKFSPPKWWKDRTYLAALLAAIVGVIGVVPIVLGWFSK